MDQRLLDILACPRCRGRLVYRHDSGDLLCKTDNETYPVERGVPVLLLDRAQSVEE